VKIKFLQQIFEKFSNIKFYENLSSGSRVVSCGRTDGRTDSPTDRQTDMTNILVALCSFYNAPKKWQKI